VRRLSVTTIVSVAAALAVGTTITLLTGASSALVGQAIPGTAKPTASGLASYRRSDLHKIRHVIVLMQENRSFDSYFGTFPGVDGIPMRNGVPTVCNPDPKTHRCIRPYHDMRELDGGGPHTAGAARRAIDNGKMDGFIRSARKAMWGKFCTERPTNPICALKKHPDTVMGYHNADEIPNYWTYARDFVLQDHMFEPNLGWSLPAHLFTVSAWSATCRTPTEPMTCKTALHAPRALHMTGKPSPTRPVYAWTDLTWLLHRHHVSWRYYIAPGESPDCADGDMTCPPKAQTRTSPSIWNPLPHFTTVHEDGQLGNIKYVIRYFKDAAAGRLPSVSWIVPNGHF
jgi:phospholipase C